MMSPNTFKDLMAGVPAPVCVVTTSHDNAPKGTTVSSLASLSLEPALVSIALAHGSTLLGCLRDSGRFAINLLAHDQADLARRFAVSGGDRFDGVDWHLEHDLPRLAGVSRFMACDIASEVPGGDHVAIFGRVVNCWMSDIPPLIYVSRQFATTTKIKTGGDNDTRRAQGECNRARDRRAG